MMKLEALPNKPESALDTERGKPLRVALVSSSSGSRGGGELYLVGLAQGLAALGHDVQSVLSDHARMDELAGLRSTNCLPSPNPELNHQPGLRCMSQASQLIETGISPVR